MKMNSQGRVTIPKEFREKYGLLPKTEVQIKMLHGRVTITPVSSRSSRHKKSTLIA